MSQKQRNQRQTFNLRKVSTTRRLQSSQQSTNRVRNIIALSSNTNSLHTAQNTQNTHNTVPIRLIRQANKSAQIQNIKQTLIQQFQSFKNPLQKVEEHQKTINSQLQKIKVQSMNHHKTRHQQISLSIHQFSNLKVYMGKVFDQICERSFQMFINQQFSYNEMRSFCCEKILLNLMHLMRDREFDCAYTECIEWEKQVRKIMDYLCNKYPQTEKIQVNKKLEEIINKTKINNFQSEDYDLLDKTNVKFAYKSSGDYTEEIMSFLNQIITITEKPVDQGKNLYSNFQIFFSNVFSLVQHKDLQIDMTIINEERLNDYQYCGYRFSQQEDIQYSQKVKSYTKFDIGCKIPLNSQIYSTQQILSGNIQIKSKSVARFIDKWIQQLRQKVFNSQKSIIQRIHRFKGQNPGDRIKLSQKQKQILAKLVNTQKQNVKNFQQNIKNNMQEITQILITNLGSYNQLTFLDQNERCMGQFACKMQSASVEYSIQKLNFLISALLRAAQKLKSQINKTKPTSFIGEDIAVNLITCKIGDLMRCRFYSRQQQVLRIFQFFKLISQNNYKNIFKIIRIKNRLNQSTRDILINGYFKNSIPCEIQLAINQTDQKQRFMDKFNHFMYQLKRAEMGTMLELCTIWVQNCPKSATFKKQIQKENQHKRKNRQNICQDAIFQFQNNKYQIIKLPCVCKICKIFYPCQKTIFQNVLFSMYKQPICGQCLTTRVTKKQRLGYFFAGAQKQQYVTNYMQKFNIRQTITQICSFQEISKYQYFVLIPINSRKINKFAIKKLEAQTFTFFVQKKITQNGELDIKAKFIIDHSKPIEEQEKKFFKKYCLFTFALPYQIRPYKFNKHNFNFILQNDLKKIQTYQSKHNNQLHCLYIKSQQHYVLYPHYSDPSICQISKLKNSLNIIALTQSIQDSKQVIDITNKRVKNQFNLISPGIRLKMNTIVKELYLNNNNLQSIGFVQWIINLQILSTKHNNLKEIPQLPESIEIVDLSHNHIQKIQGITSKTYLKLKYLNLSQNQIPKIQNLHKVPNLKQLHLNNNKIQVIEGLNNLNFLKNLYISFNPIKKIENICRLMILELLSIGNSEINFLENLDKLEELNTLVIDNCNIRFQQKHIPLPPKIKKLNLSKNRLKSMQTLKALPHIQQLILNQNFITVIQPDNWLQNIKLLNLSNNKIDQIPNLKLLSQLKQLYLSHNLISQIKGLQQNLFLSILDISNNKITELKNIKYLLNLQKLFVRNNKINFVEDFQNLRSLKEIQLANNFIEKIMVLPKSITKINLQNNKVTNLGWINMLLEKRSNNYEESVKIQEINLRSNPLPQLMIVMVKSVFQMIGTRIII